MTPAQHMAAGNDPPFVNTGPLKILESRGFTDDDVPAVTDAPGSVGVTLRVSKEKVLAQMGS